VNQRPGETHPLLHPLGERGEVFAADSAEVGELLDLGKSTGPRLPPEAETAGEKVEVLPHLNVAEVGQRVGHVADQVPHLFRIVDHRHAVVEDVAPVGIVERGHDLDRGGFARSVRADETEDVPRSEIERNVVHRLRRSERAGEIANLNFHLWLLPKN